MTASFRLKRDIPLVSSLWLKIKVSESIRTKKERNDKMTKVEVLRQIATNLSGKVSGGETIVDCLKEIILSLKADADINKCNTIVDCLNLINKIKGSAKIFHTKTDCLKELILTQDSASKVNDLVTISDCIGGLATVLGSTDNKNGTVAEKLLALKEVVKLEEEEPKDHDWIPTGNMDEFSQELKCIDCEETKWVELSDAEIDCGMSATGHTIIEQTHEADDAYCAYIEKKCSNCGLFAESTKAKHDWALTGNKSSTTKEEKCSKCGLTRWVEMTMEEIIAGLEPPSGQ